MCVFTGVHAYNCVWPCASTTYVESGAALPSCLPGRGRAAAAAWLAHQLLSHFRTHSDSLSLYPSLAIHPLRLFTFPRGFQSDIPEYEKYKSLQYSRVSLFLRNAKLVPNCSLQNNVPHLYWTVVYVLTYLKAAERTVILK